MPVVVAKAASVRHAELVGAGEWSSEPSRREELYTCLDEEPDSSRRNMIVVFGDGEGMFDAMTFEQVQLSYLWPGPTSPRKQMA